MKKILTTLAPLVLAGSLFAEWQKVDDMESYTVDAQLMDSPWTWYTVPTENFSVLPSATTVADPFDAGQGNVLCFSPGVPAAGSSNATLERALPEGMRIQDPFPETGVKTTFYFKVARPLVEGAPGEADITWGLVAEEARNTETGEHAYGSYSVLGRYEIDGIMDIRDGGTYNNLVENALNTEVWYEIWYVVDHAANTFSQYIKGGSDFPEQTQIYENAAYRFETFADLETLLIVTTAGGVDAIKGKDPIYFDDFHIDVESENLSSPGGAVWQLIDDMESYTADAQLESDPWTWYTVPTENFSVLPSATTVADPFDADQGQVLCFSPGVPAAGSSNATLERALPEELRIKDPFPETGVLSTFYFRVARPLVSGAPGEADITWGLVAEEARNTETGEHAYGSYSVLGRYEIDGIMDIRDGGTYNNLVENALNTEVWYEIWYVVDHAANTFSQYIKGGSDFPEQTQIYENAAYRFETFADLETLLIVTTAGGVDAIKGKDPIYFDDFYMTIGAMNLTSPGDPVVDTTPRAEATDAGSSTITMTAESVANAEVGQLVFLDDGTELGKIASIDGQVITLEAPLAVAIAADSRLTFVEDNNGGGFVIVPDGKLINISTRGIVGDGDDVLIGGFIIREGGQTVFIAVAASELIDAGVANVLADPVLTVQNQQTGEVVAVNDNWEDDPDQAQLISDLWGGAPPLDAGSTSAGVVVTLSEGNWTGVVSAADGTASGGVVNFQVFEAD